MKHVFKRFLRIITLAFALTIALALYPYARDWLSARMPQGKYQRLSTVLTHELKDAGDLTVIRYQDTGILHTETNALFLGSVQEVTVPYAYEIGLGFPLNEVTITPQDDSLLISLPPIRMLYDSFQVTGSPEIKDFWYQLTEKRYQDMLDNQAAACRKEYTDQEVYQQEAWNAACKTLEDLFTQWAQAPLSLSFISQAP